MTDFEYLNFVIEYTNNGSIEWCQDGDKYKGVYIKAGPFGDKMLGGELTLEQIGTDYEWAYFSCFPKGEGRSMYNSKVYKLVKLVRRTIDENSNAHSSLL